LYGFWIKVDLLIIDDDEDDKEKFLGFFGLKTFLILN
jgi:hypothetical protein